ncbi:hypothetical protein NYR54_15195 [Chelativorans sp. SCAU2101]|jgi:hypothetical protein|uniref:Uncharacterized protein n=1 Tax=Chelativorans petroleitrophicus TaxID=2975484 RepID=A0A9X2XAA2_9HYPH|nr:hypothetical protein [Chelativorans petroleitrophicus]MCT8991623.1 hypothetical protein [Chelativorans petroleitrophicus]
MKQVHSIIFKLASTLAALALTAGFLLGQQPPAGAQVLLAQGAPDCFAIGQQVAAQQGGTLAGAQAENRGGQTVCRIIVLVPARGGERPRRMEVTVPAR